MANAAVMKLTLRQVAVTCGSFTKKHLAFGGLRFCLPMPPREATARCSLSCFDSEDVIWGQLWHMLWVPAAKLGTSGWGPLGGG